jgi:hypothetical protein
LPLIGLDDKEPTLCSEHSSLANPLEKAGDIYSVQFRRRVDSDHSRFANLSLSHFRIC